MERLKYGGRCAFVKVNRDVEFNEKFTELTWKGPESGSVNVKQGNKN